MTAELKDRMKLTRDAARGEVTRYGAESVCVLDGSSWKVKQKAPLSP